MVNATTTTTTTTNNFDFQAWRKSNFVRPLTEGEHEGTITKWEDISKDEKGCFRLTIQMSDRVIHPCLFGLSIKIALDELAGQLDLSNADSIDAAYDQCLNKAIKFQVERGFTSTGKTYTNYIFSAAPATPQSEEALF